MLFKNTLGGHPIKSEANYREISNLGAMTTINKLQIERSEQYYVLNSYTKTYTKCQIV
jgi:hypothetical protein